MKLRLLTSTHDVEILVAAAMLTTTSGVSPSTLFHRMKNNNEKAGEVVSRLEVQHGSILEHNRFVWQFEAEEHQVLAILLKCKFFNFTRLGATNWLVSANLRTLVEYAMNEDEYSHLLLESIRVSAPTVYKVFRRINNEG